MISALEKKKKKKHDAGSSHGDKIMNVLFFIYRVKGVKTEWVQVWANSIHFTSYAMKSKQTYQTSKTITIQ